MPESATMDSIADASGWNDCLITLIPSLNPVHARRLRVQPVPWVGLNETNCLGTEPGMLRGLSAGQNPPRKQLDDLFFSPNPVNCHCRSPMVSRF